MFLVWIFLQMLYEFEYINYFHLCLKYRHETGNVEHPEVFIQYCQLKCFIDVTLFSLNMSKSLAWCSSILLSLICLSLTQPILILFQCVWLDSTKLNSSLTSTSFFGLYPVQRNFCYRNSGSTWFDSILKSSLSAQLNLIFYKNLHLIEHYHVVAHTHCIHSGP